MSRPVATETVFRVLAHDTRRRILEMLRRGDLTAGEISCCFRHAQPTISEHLRFLTAAGLVAQRRTGRTRTYTLTARALRSVSEWLNPFEAFWKP